MSRKKQEAEEGNRMLSRAEGVVGQGLDTLERLMGPAAQAALAASREASGEYAEKSAKAASHVAWLTKQAAQIAGELRKVEAHNNTQLKKLTLATVLEWYRQLDDDSKGDFERRIEAIRSGASILTL